MTLRCPTCGHDNPPEARFCGNCGTELAVVPGVSPTPPATKTTATYAGFWMRLGAWLIDMVILQVALTILSIFISPLALLGAGLEGAFVAFGIMAMTSLVLSALYFVLLTGLRGQTLGKMALGIKVVDSQGRVPGLRRALLRESVGKFVSFIALFLGFLWVAWNQEKQGWHDKMAATHVIRSRRES